MYKRKIVFQFEKSERKKWVRGRERERVLFVEAPMYSHAVEVAIYIRSTIKPQSCQILNSFRDQKKNHASLTGEQSKM